MTEATIHPLAIPQSKSSPAVREILLGWLESAITSEITQIEISGVVDGENRRSCFAIVPPIFPEGG